MTDASEATAKPTPAEVPAHPKRFVFLGSPPAAVPALRALVDAGYEAALVVSAPDRRRSRRGAPEPTPVKAAALELGVPVTDQVDEAGQVNADIGVVVAFGQMISDELLAALPMVNLHFSLLPRWRGAAPVERALLAGDKTTGVCVMQVVTALDAGGVFARAEVEVGEATSQELLEDLSHVGAKLLVETFSGGFGEAQPQQGEPTYARKIHPPDLMINWSKPAEELVRLIRVGGAWTQWKGDRFKVLEARVANTHVAETGTEQGNAPGSLTDLSVACGSGALELIRVQPAGKAVMDAESWRRGNPASPDDRFVEPDPA